MENNARPETGPMEFDDDWRGIFIRGDDALLGFLPSLIMIKEHFENSNSKDSLLVFQLESMINLLQSANHHGPEDDLQKMKSFSQCRVVSLPVVK